MQRASVTWHGTRDESTALLAAIGQNCECKFGKSNQREETCTAHKMLVGDQRALDGLLMVRRCLRAKILAEEFGEEMVVDGAIPNIRPW